MVVSDVSGGQEGLRSQLAQEVAGPWANGLSCLRTNLVENLRCFYLLITCCMHCLGLCVSVCVHAPSAYELHNIELVRGFFRLERENFSF